MVVQNSKGKNIGSDNVQSWGKVLMGIFCNNNHDYGDHDDADGDDGNDGDDGDIGDDNDGYWPKLLRQWGSYCEDSPPPPPAVFVCQISS